MNLLLEMGAALDNIYMCDSKGVIHSDRDDLSEHKARFATETDPRLIDFIPPAVARAAIDTGVARTDYPSHYPQPVVDDPSTPP